MMNKTKRFLCLALALVMVFAMLPTFALAADSDILKIEGENGTASGDAMTRYQRQGSYDPTASGENYAENISGDANTWTYTFDSLAAGDAVVNLYYMQGDFGNGDPPRSFGVWINGGQMQTVACQFTGEWDGTAVSTTPASVEFEAVAGENTIVIGGVNGAYAPNLDYITIELPAPDPEVVTLQAEDPTVATLANGAKASSSNAGVIGWIGDTAEGTVTFNFDRLGGGNVLMNIYYAAGDMNPNRTLAYTVNGGEMQVVTGGSTGGWGVVGETPIVAEIELQKGANTIVFSGEGNGAQALNLDRIELVRIGPKATLSAEAATVKAGEEIRVSVTLSNIRALAGAEAVDGTIAGIQFNVIADGLTLTGFEPSEAFEAYDWGCKNGIVLGFSGLETESVTTSDLGNEVVIGDLVFTAGDKAGDVTVELDIEEICDDKTNSYTKAINTETAVVTVYEGDVPPTEPTNPSEEVTAEEIVAVNANVEVNVGESKALEYTLKPENATIADISWFSHDTSVAEVDGSGVVYGVGAGTAEIEATLNGRNTVKFTVTVVKSTEPQPTEPQPTEPQPTEPQPTEPQPTEPQPTEPGEPLPSEPQPSEPQPTEPGEHECSIAGFKDVNLNAWYHEPLDYMVSNGYMNGKSDTVMDPDGQLTRAELVKILYEIAGAPAVDDLAEPFTDVSEDQWFYNAIVWAFNEEVVTGTSDTTFSPDSKITREQLATILYRYEDEPEVTGNLDAFKDAGRVNDYAVDAMTWAVETGVITGITPDTLAPRPVNESNPKDTVGLATRAQAATMLMRYLEK